MIYFFGSISVLSALCMVLAQQPIRSALALLTCMLSLAGIYAARGAHLIFALQLIIYVGAIMVFLIYIVMLFDVKVAKLKRFTAVGLFAAILAILTLFGIHRLVQPSLQEKLIYSPGPVEVTTQTLSQLLFSKYMVAFELASILLLTGLIAITSFFAKSADKRKEHH